VLVGRVFTETRKDFDCRSYFLCNTHRRDRVHAVWLARCFWYVLLCCCDRRFSFLSDLVLARVCRFSFRCVLSSWLALNAGLVCYYARVRLGQAGVVRFCFVECVLVIVTDLRN
jgi:hypothetical protein